MPKPMAVAMAILENSFLSGFVHLKHSHINWCIMIYETFVRKTLLQLLLSPFDQPYRVFAELLQWLQVLLNLIHRIYPSFLKLNSSQVMPLSCVPSLEESRMGRMLQLTGRLLDLRTTRVRLYTENITGQDTGWAQWRVVTVRRCTAAPTDGPGPAAGKGNLRLVLSAASVCHSPAGWLMVGFGLVNPVWEGHLSSCLLSNSFDFHRRYWAVQSNLSLQSF